MPKRNSSAMSRRAVMRLVQPEKKYFDDHYQLAAVAAGTTPTAMALGCSVRTQPVNETGISQNSTPNGRIGAKIRIESLAIHMRFGIDIQSASATALQSTALFRVCLVEDRQPNRILPVWETSGVVSGVVDATGLDMATTGSVLAHRNLNTTGRLRILHDRVYSINLSANVSAGTAATFNLGRCIKYLSIYKKFGKGVVRKYAQTATDGPATAIEKNGHYLFVMGDVSNIGTHHAQVVTRLRYTDA